MKRWISRLPGESEGLESGASNGKGLEKALGLRAYIPNTSAMALKMTEYRIYVYIYNT